MKFKKFKPWHIDLMAVGICALLALIAYGVGVYPVIRRHQGFALRATELKAQQKRATKLSGKVAHVASEITQINQELADNTLQLKPSGQVNSHLARIAALAGKCGLKIDQLRPDKSLKGSRYQTVPIYLVGSGDFPACVRLLQELHRGFPDTSVASFEVTGDPTKPTEPTKLRVDLLWYALAEVDLSKG
jgi:Tfp pilus assembly protein PilO